MSYSDLTTWQGTRICPISNTIQPPTGSTMSLELVEERRPVCCQPKISNMQACVVYPIMVFDAKYRSGCPDTDTSPWTSPISGRGDGKYRPVAIPLTIHIKTFYLGPSVAASSAIHYKNHAQGSMIIMMTSWHGTFHITGHLWGGESNDDR